MRIDFISLKSRIFLAFTFFTVIFIAIGLFIFYSQKKQLSEFQTIQYVSEQKVLHDTIEKKMRETQSYAQQFINTGRVSDYKRVTSLLESISEVKKEALKKPYDKNIKKILVKVESMLSAYRKYFETAVEERKITETLTTSRLEELKQKFVKSLKRESNVEMSNKSKVFMQSQLIEKKIIQYTKYLRSQYIKEALELIDNTQEKLEGKNYGKAGEFLIELRNLVIQIEQSTQAYLYLVNVVMAAEASELLYQTQLLKRISIEYQRDLQKSIIDSSMKDFKTLMIVSFVTIMITIVLSYAISSSITTPLASIGNTFRNLARGQKVETIPGLEYKDEIGELAKAADVFKQKNAQTESLLKESRTLTKDLELNKSELDKSNRELEQFVFTVSHDLKSPLVTSMGYIGMIKELAETGDMKRVIKMLDKVVKANNRMSLLISDLLELSRVGRVEIEKITIDMSRLLSELKESFSQKSKELNFVIHLSGECINVQGNESRVMQVFENLISNALKYGVSQKDKHLIEISCEEKSDEVVYRVRDEGQGIPEVFHQKVFALFSRLNQEQEGTGVGLAVVKKVMDFHKGIVWIESPASGGTVFCLSFPK